MIAKDLVAASSRPLILSLLAEGASYGYALIQRVRELSHGEMEWTDGMLYPVLHRLEKEGLIASEWRCAISNSAASLKKRPSGWRAGAWASRRILPPTSPK